MPPKTKAPHRLTLSEIVERQLSGNAEGSSVKLTLNARGDTQIEVKVSTAQSESGGTVEGASMVAQAIYDALTVKYVLAEAPADES